MNTKVPINDRYDEACYYDAYKVIRNKFRKHNQLQTIDLLLNYLNHPVKDELIELKKHPWLILLLIKWIIIDDQFHSLGKNEMTQEKVITLMQMMLDLRAKCRMPSQYEHHTLFFRNVAYQQFIYQRGLGLQFLGRQTLLFGSASGSSYFDEHFSRITGIHVERFINLLHMLMCRFAVPDNNDVMYRDISIGWLSSVFSIYPAEEIKMFLDSLSVNLSELRGRLLSASTCKRTCHEQYEQTPFMRFPFISARETYTCVYPLVLYRTMEHFIYDTLRENNAENFMKKFGPTFEQYVEKTLTYSGINYVPERVLMQELDGFGKVVDFLINDAGANVFIDAKGVEMSNVGKITHRADILLGRTKDSILKAIEQAYETNFRLLTTHSENPVIQFRHKSYLVVVTYRDMYLGTGKTFHEVVAGDKIDQLCAKYPKEAHIPLENIYFLTIDDLDLFCEGIRNGLIGMVSGIDKAQALDKEPRTRKFDFILHLMSWGLDQYPEFLDQAFDNVVLEMKSAFGD